MRTKMLYRLSIVFFSLFLIQSVSFGQDGALDVQDPQEKKAIEATIQHYFKGGAESDISEFKKAMHPNAYLKFISKDKYREIDMPTYYGFFKSGKKNKRESKILSIDITGNAAAAKIRIYTKTRIFTDYFTLLKFKEGWKIVSKTSYTMVK
ncbi:hypothetical protein BKI52_17300 [marine bacterium AO1-C]|nr:hypothetical protein BKI52_17300 [marine bacterium AO1-C]